ALRSEGYDVAIVDLLGRKVTGSEDPPVFSVEGTYATRGKPAFATALERFRPNVLLTLADTWDHYYVPALLSGRSVHWISYVPLEQAPCRGQLNVHVVPELAGRPFNVREHLLAADAVVAHNDFARTELQALLSGQQIDVIPHGVDTSVFSLASI